MPIESKKFANKPLYSVSFDRWPNLFGDRDTDTGPAVLIGRKISDEMFVLDPSSEF